MFSYRIVTRSLAIAALVLGATAAGGQVRVIRRPDRASDRDKQTQANAFQWSGELGAGQKLILRNLNGSISVERASGNTLEITASKQWNKGDPALVKIDATRAGKDVVVCARWTAETKCDATTYNSSNEEHGGGWSRSNDTEVSFVVKLPAGAGASLNTTNGQIDIVGTASPIEARTTNGEIVIESSEGPSVAHTTNGDVSIHMVKLPAGGGSYHTTNGSITIAMPEATDANVEARTTLGRVQLDFPVKANGAMSSRRVSGVIGRGGPLLDIVTTLGSIRIEKK